MGEKNSQGTGATGDQDKDKGTTISNADVKAHPLFQKVTQELADERKTSKSMQSRLEKLEAAENDRQTKKLEAEENYEAATQKKIDAAIEQERKAWQAEQSVKDKKAEAKLELTKAGFKNEKFLNMSLSEFDHEKQSVEDFVKTVSNDPESAPFLDAQKGATKKKADFHPSQGGGKGLMTPAEIQKARESGSDEEKAKANADAEALWVANQGSTGLPT